MGEETVSHDELSAAQDAATEQVAEEAVEEEGVEAVEDEEVEEESEDEEIPEEPPADPGRNQERSKLGREVQGLKEMVQVLVAQNQQLMQNTAPAPREPDDEEVDIVTTKDVGKHIAKYEQTKNANLQRYNADLVSRVADMGRELSDEEFKEVSEIFDKNFKMYTKNSATDALINYNNAKATYYQQQIGKKINPLSKNNGKTLKNLGGASKTKTTPKTGLKKLHNKDAIALAKSFGWNDEQIDSALSENLTNMAG